MRGHTFLNIGLAEGEALEDREKKWVQLVTTDSSGKCEKNSFCVGQHVLAVHRLKMGPVRKAVLKLRAKIVRICTKGRDISYYLKKLGLTLLFHCMYTLLLHL